MGGTIPGSRVIWVIPVRNTVMGADKYIGGNMGILLAFEHQEKTYCGVSRRLNSRLLGFYEVYITKNFGPERKSRV